MDTRKQQTADSRQQTEAARPGWGLGGSRRARLSHSLAVGWGLVLALAVPSAWAAPAVTDREPVTMSVVAVNPSGEKSQTVPVKIDLPTEITPSDVVDAGDLTLEYDDARQSYFLYKEAVELAPKETRVFEVLVRDVWLVPEPELNSLLDYTNLLLGRLESSEYAPTAKQMAASVTERLDRIRSVQNDETLSRKSRIGAYRNHLQVIAKVKEDLARMEKLLTFVGGPPVPEMMKESPLKSDAPSQTTTWMVIFLIVIFTGLLGAQFFFTWQRRTQVSQDLAMVKQAAFSGRPAGNGHGNPPTPPGRTDAPRQTPAAR